MSESSQNLGTFTGVWMGHKGPSTRQYNVPSFWLDFIDLCSRGYSMLNEFPDKSSNSGHLYGRVHVPYINRIGQSNSFKCPIIIAAAFKLDYHIQVLFVHSSQRDLGSGLHQRIGDKPDIVILPTLDSNSPPDWHQKEKK